jgi:hypothetical protein
MRICSNCGSQLSCGCQRRTASNGTECCENCIAGYEAMLHPPPPIPLPETKTEDGQ